MNIEEYQKDFTMRVPQWFNDSTVGSRRLGAIENMSNIPVRSCHWLVKDKVVAI